MMTKRQMIAAYDRGLLDECAKELLRYGTIEADKEWHTESGYYAGWTRVYSIRLHGLLWSLEKLNGEVRSVGYEVAS